MCLVKRNMRLLSQMSSYYYCLPNLFENNKISSKFKNTTDMHCHISWKIRFHHMQWKWECPRNMMPPRCFVLFYLDFIFFLAPIFSLVTHILTISCAMLPYTSGQLFSHPASHYTRPLSQTGVSVQVNMKINQEYNQMKLCKGFSRWFIPGLLRSPGLRYWVMGVICVFHIEIKYFRAEFSL